jgi:septal ring factor EnvC (AmiA/AmiB activator)
VSGCLDPVPTCPGHVICDLARQHAAHDWHELRELLVRYRHGYFAAVDALPAYEQQATAREQQADRLVAENRALRHETDARLHAAREHYRQLQAEARRLRQALDECRV